MNRSFKEINAAKQRGVALATAMIFLVALTLLGVTALSTSSVEEKMAGNEQILQSGFRTAENGIAEVFAGGFNNLSTIQDSLLDNYSDASSTCNADTVGTKCMRYDTVTSFRGSGNPAPGNSLIEFSSYKFDITSSAFLVDPAGDVSTPTEDDYLTFSELESGLLVPAAPKQKAK